MRIRFLPLSFGQSQLVLLNGDVLICEDKHVDRSEYIRQNIEQFHNNTAASRYKQLGVTDQSAKLSNAGFNKLMDSRGISQEARSDLKNSFSSNSRMEVRHAHAGERFVTTHGIERSSGVFVSKESLGNTPADRINNGALPYTNTAEFETTVELGRDQNLIIGEIAPQSKFSMMDPEQQLREGGAIQVVTDGGYHNGAVINRDAKFPAVIGQTEEKSESKDSAVQQADMQMEKGKEPMENRSDFDESFLDAEQDAISTQDMDAGAMSDANTDGIGNE